MSFTTLPLGVVLAGLAALAAGLFVLQRLRVRHRETPVVTTLFWREAVEESRARVLFQRFRHPWAYLLVLLIAALVWLAAAEPRIERETTSDVVLLLDASARMSRGDRFETAVATLEEEIDGLAADRRTVILCGAEPVTLLAPGEDALLLRRRLGDAEPEACPPTLAATIRSVAATVGDRDVLVRVFGDSPVPEDRLALLPDRVTVERATASPEEDANRGIVALGIAEPRSGDWGLVDVRFETSGGVPDDVRLIHDGSSLLEFAGPATVLRDVAARGGPLAVEHGAARAALRLPDRPPIRVSIRGEVPGALRTVLVADPAIVLVEEKPDVVIADVLDPEVPSLVMAPDHGDAIVVEQPEVGRDAMEPLEAAIRDLALDQIDAAGAAERAGRPIVVSAAVATRRGVRIWRSLFTDRFDLVRQRAFPILVGRCVRWLADVEPLVPVVAAGRPIVERTGDFEAAFGDAFTPPTAGEFEAVNGPPVVASLLDRTLATIPTHETEPAPDLGGPIPLVTWLGLAAFALLMAEWMLLRRGRIP